MKGAIATKINHWWIAVKPGALVKLLLPLAVGLAMGYGVMGVVAWKVIAISLVLALAAELTIVLLNDYADSAADTLHHHKYPQLFEVRVIPGQLLGGRTVLAAGLLAAAAVLGLGVGLAWGMDRPYALYLFAGGLVLFWLYSFGPAKLNYRGCGEVLEMLGVGGLLPLTGYYLYTGTFTGFRLHLAAPVFLLALVSALASGLKHAPADRESGKKTFVVLFGFELTRQWIFVLQAASVLWCLVFFIEGSYDMAVFAFGVMAPTAVLYRAREVFPLADTEDLAALKAYKGALLRVQYFTVLGLVLDLVYKPNM